MNAPPATAAAVGANHRSTASVSTDGASLASSRSSVLAALVSASPARTYAFDRDIARATTAMRPLIRQASQSVMRLPKTSTSTKFAASVPATAPSVLTP
jgi:hypothetical protein